MKAPGIVSSLSLLLLVISSVAAKEIDIPFKQPANECGEIISGVVVPGSFAVESSSYIMKELGSYLTDCCMRCETIEGCNYWTWIEEGSSMGMCHYFRHNACDSETSSFSTHILAFSGSTKACASKLSKSLEESADSEPEALAGTSKGVESTEKPYVSAQSNKKLTAPELNEESDAEDEKAELEAMIKAGAVEDPRKEEEDEDEKAELAAMIEAGAIEDPRKKTEEGRKSELADMIEAGAVEEPRKETEEEDEKAELAAMIEAGAVEEPRKETEEEDEKADLAAMIEAGAIEDPRKEEEEEDGKAELAAMIEAGAVEDPRKEKEDEDAKAELSEVGPVEDPRKETEEDEKAELKAMIEAGAVEDPRKEEEEDEKAELAAMVEAGAVENQRKEVEGEDDDKAELAAMIEARAVEDPGKEDVKVELTAMIEAGAVEDLRKERSKKSKRIKRDKRGERREKDEMEVMVKTHAISGKKIDDDENEEKEKLALPQVLTKMEKKAALKAARKVIHVIKSGHAAGEKRKKHLNHCRRMMLC